MQSYNVILGDIRKTVQTNITPSYIDMENKYQPTYSPLGVELYHFIIKLYKRKQFNAVFTWIPMLHLLM